MSTDTKQGAQGKAKSLPPTSELKQLDQAFLDLYRRVQESTEQTQCGVASLIRIMNREEQSGDRESVTALAESWRARGYSIQARMLDELLEAVFQPPLEELLERALNPTFEESEPSVSLQSEPELDLGPEPDIELPEPGEPLL